MFLQLYFICALAESAIAVAKHESFPVDCKTVNTDMQYRTYSFQYLHEILLINDDEVGIAYFKHPVTGETGFSAGFLNIPMV